MSIKKARGAQKLLMLLNPMGSVPKRFGPECHFGAWKIRKRKPRPRAHPKESKPTKTDQSLPYLTWSPPQLSSNLHPHINLPAPNSSRRQTIPALTKLSVLEAMAASTNFALIISLALLLSAFRCSASAPRKLALVQQPLTVLKYHDGPLLKGNYAVNLLYYGRFTPSQRAIVADFVRSLSSPHLPPPSAAAWWVTTSSYKAGPTRISLGAQTADEKYSLGKSLKLSQISSLARKLNPGPTSITAVLTSSDVAVEGFCSSRCGTHWSDSGSRTYAWVGNPSTQCPGQCAWPFHQPIYGPQTPPLVSPNGDVGVDGMIINLATVLAGTVTNPFGNGFYQGPATAPLEAVSACTGMFGTGSYPGYAGKLLVDPVTGASYNANGVSGRKYLLPAMWDPKTSQCKTLV